MSLLFVSCSLISDDELVAKIGKHRLYKSEVNKYIPASVSPEDSALLANQYVNAWARELLYNEKAEQKLSKSELDVTKELEDYKKSLLKFRYEQRYIEERLDTCVTNEQIKDYYDKNLDKFDLTNPVLKVRFLDIMKDSRDKDAIVEKMASTDYNQLEEAKGMAFKSALRYFDKSDEWIDAQVLAKEFGTDMETMFSHRKGNYIMLETADKADVKIAYVCAIVSYGPAPIDCCYSSIKDIIISKRKHEIVSTLEQDLLNDAIKKKHLVIY